MSWASRTSPVQAGDKVAYAKRFLQSIDCHIGGMASARGVVIAVVPVGDVTVADIAWDTPDLPERVNVRNLSRVMNSVVMEHD